MVASDAFESLTQVLELVESTDTEIEAVSVRGPTTADGEEITAELTVASPVFGGVSLHDDVSVEAEAFDLTDRRAEFDVTVTVPVGADVPAAPARADTVEEFTAVRSDSVPVYKDPAALQAAYDACDTFPEMTEALGADVTSETVRRYTVEYDIHDPTDSTPHVGGFDPSDAQQPQDDQADSQSIERTGDAPEDPDGIGARSVAELLAESDGQDGDNLVADGLGIAREMTVADLAATVNQATSLETVTRRLDLRRSTARRLLSELDLLSLVTHRLAADQIRVSHAEIERRITGGDG